MVAFSVRDTLSRFISLLARDTRGNVLIIFGAALFPLIVMIGSGLDLGVRYMSQAKLQNACDAAVLAGRQAMEGNTWDSAALADANRFFAFNFPEGTHGAQNLEFTVAPNPDDPSEIVGAASASVPTSLMRLFGVNQLDIAVECNAMRDMGHNDIVLVLDVTGSMEDPASNGGGTKIARLRTGAVGLYRALEDADGSITRFGIVPYSHTVNVARSLATDDILRDQQYVDGEWLYRYCEKSWSSWNCSERSSTDRPTEGYSKSNTVYIDSVRFRYTGLRTVAARNSSWATNNSDSRSIDAFRNSGNGCIEERPSSGNAASPVALKNSVVQADVDARSTGSSNAARQFGRYDPAVQRGQTQVGCPSEARRLATISSEANFNAAINSATARVTGGTYHDVGMLWGLRFISRTGFFAAGNPTHVGDIPVNQHIVFMTDGMLDTGATLYSSHGVEAYQGRTKGTGSNEDRHLARFWDACNLAKAAGITVWVIALDVTKTNDVSRCATTPSHFYTSNGSDLEQVFGSIGQGIGNLRLSR